MTHHLDSNTEGNQFKREGETHQPTPVRPGPVAVAQLLAHGTQLLLRGSADLVGFQRLLQLALRSHAREAEGWQTTLDMIMTSALKKKKVSRKRRTEKQQFN